MALDDFFLGSGVHFVGEEEDGSLFLKVERMRYDNRRVIYGRGSSRDSMLITAFLTTFCWVCDGYKHRVL